MTNNRITGPECEVMSNLIKTDIQRERETLFPNCGLDF